MKFPCIRRSLYWPFFLALTLVNIVTSVGVSNAPAGSGPVITQLTVFALTGLAWLIVAAARANDMGKSPWLALLTLVPFVGWGIVFWLGFAEGMPKEGDTPSIDQRAEG